MNMLIKMVFYKSEKVTINISGLIKVIIHVVMWHHGILDSIFID